MSSNINPYNIDGTFPVAGQDNSSQGFRDNFTNTKNNFLFAQAEITDLQNKALVTSALNGQPINNDMAGTILRRPQLAAWTQTLLDNGAVSGPISLDFNQANFQKITAAGSMTLNFINWPSSIGTGALGYGIMRVWIVITNKNQTVTLPASCNIADDSISNYNGNGVLSFDNVGNYIFDVSSIDGGTTFMISDLTRNRSQFTDANFYYNIEVSPTMYVGFGGGLLNSSNTAVTGLFPQGLTNIRNIVTGGADMFVSAGSLNSFGIGNLALANVATGIIDTGTIGGYTVSGGRGNILTTGVAPVSSNDMLGYLNAEAFTGNGLPTNGNTFAQTAGIYFFATGSNVVGGLGGNISFFTVPDGGPATNNIRQALSIENDQSTRAYGTFSTYGGIVEGAAIVANLALSATIGITSNISTVILDNTGSANFTNPVLLTLPATPSNGLRVKISAVCPVASANIWGNTAAVKWTSSTQFSAGNVASSYTYISASNTWYRVD